MADQLAATAVMLTDDLAGLNGVGWQHTSVHSWPKKLSALSALWSGWAATPVTR